MWDDSSFDQRSFDERSWWFTITTGTKRFVLHLVSKINTAITLVSKL